MSDQDKQQAKAHAGRATRQGKHAAKNAAKAAQLAAQPIVEGVEDAAEQAADTAKKFDVRAMSRGLNNSGQGAIALSIAVTAATFAFDRFRKARNEKLIVDSNVAKADHHIRPSGASEAA